MRQSFRLIDRHKSHVLLITDKLLDELIARRPHPEDGVYLPLLHSKVGRFIHHG